MCWWQVVFQDGPPHVTILHPSRGWGVARSPSASPSRPPDPSQQRRMVGRGHASLGPALRHLAALLSCGGNRVLCQKPGHGGLKQNRLRGLSPCDGLLLQVESTPRVGSPGAAHPQGPRCLLCTCSRTLPTTFWRKNCCG